MADIKSLAEKRGTLLHFDPRVLKIMKGLNSRDINTADNQEHIEWLATDIAKHGVKQPLVVFQEGDDVYLTDGHCRLTATMLAISRGADIKTVPAIVEARGTNEGTRVLSQITYNSGKQLTPLEQGHAFKKAVDLGWKVADIAAETGKSVSFINQQLAFLEAPLEVHNLVKEGKVSSTMAAKVIRQKGKAEGTKLLKETVAKAAASGKKRVTEKHTKSTKDMLWLRVVKWVKKNEGGRPRGVDDEHLIEALTLLNEP